MRRVEEAVRSHLDESRTGIKHPDLVGGPDQVEESPLQDTSEEDALYWASTVHVGAMRLLGFYWDAVGDDKGKERITRHMRGYRLGRRQLRRMFREPWKEETEAWEEDTRSPLSSNISTVRVGIDDLSDAIGARRELTWLLEEAPLPTSDTAYDDFQPMAVATVRVHEEALLQLARRVDDTLERLYLAGELEFLD